mmetsp:Transcript_138877/g.241626  ORF Transcript_138877/g.241626 Transcript_138877/m.241626 type:complete len:605 (+) Transcript_138877:26-1840(+)
MDHGAPAGPGGPGGPGGVADLVIPRQVGAKVGPLVNRLGAYFRTGQWSKAIDTLDILFAIDPRRVNQSFTFQIEDDSPDKYKMSPLMLAAYHGDLHICKMLVHQYHADCSHAVELFTDEDFVWEVNLKEGWILLNPLECQRLEIGLKAFKEGGGSAKVRFERHDPDREAADQRTYEFDVQEMKQVRLKTGKARSIRRSSIKDNPWAYHNTMREIALWTDDLPDDTPKFSVKQWTAKDIPTTKAVAHFFKEGPIGRPLDAPMTAADLPYELDKFVHRPDLTPKAGLHAKEAFEDPKGILWLFKPAGQDFLIDVEVACAKLQRGLGLLAPLIFFITGEEAESGLKLEKKGGSLQRMFGVGLDRGMKGFVMTEDKLKGPPCTLVEKSEASGNWKIRLEDGTETEKSKDELLFDDLNLTEGAFNGPFDPSKLNKGHTLWLQRHHVFDWLISNFDAHKEQYIRLRGEFDPFLNIVPIDKGQAFKFCWDRTFNKIPGKHPFDASLDKGHRNIYSAMDRSLKNGEKPPGWADLRNCKAGGEDGRIADWFNAFLDHVVNIDDGLLRALFDKYAQNAPHIGPDRAKEFLDKLIEHKNGIKKEFVDYHNSLPAF